MNRVCSPFGLVNRIVMIRKNGVQAMVEFNSLEQAKYAKSQINGADIYAGCCTLRIEYARNNKLNIKFNNNDTWDYTKTDMSEPMPPPPAHFQSHEYNQRYAPPMDRPPYDPYDPYYDRQRPHHPGPMPPYDQGPRRYDPPMPHRQDRGYDDRFTPYGTRRGYDDREYPPDPRGPRANSGGYGRGPMRPKDAGAVVIVYNLHKKLFNCEMVFNLLCLYGNVLKVKFLKLKEGSAMVEMMDSASCERVIDCITSRRCFGNTLNVTWSKLATLDDVKQPHQLPDGTDSFCVYINDKRNRYSSSNAGKNRAMAPTTCLHFFNAPPLWTEDDLLHEMRGPSLVDPIDIHVLTDKDGQHRKALCGFLEYETEEEATNALILRNHHHLREVNQHGQNYILKLCFTHPSRKRQQALEAKEARRNQKKHNWKPNPDTSTSFIPPTDTQPPPDFESQRKDPPQSYKENETLAAEQS